MANLLELYQFKILKLDENILSLVSTCFLTTTNPVLTGFCGCFVLFGLLTRMCEGLSSSGLMSPSLEESEPTKVQKILVCCVTRWLDYLINIW